MRTDQIDKHTLEIAQADDEVYTNMQELADELPDHSPRYILLSYPLTLVRSAISPTGTLRAYVKLAIWSSFGTLRTALLPARHLQRGATDALCWSERVNEEHRRDREGH